MDKAYGEHRGNASVFESIGIKRNAKVFIYKSQTFTVENVAFKKREILVEEKQKSSRWIRCLICSGKTRTKVYEDTILVKFPIYCPKCKEEIRVDVVQFKMVLSK